MGIKESVEHSGDDSELPATKSYGNVDLDIQLVRVDKIKRKKGKTDGEVRLVRGEILLEKVNDAILLRNRKGKGISLYQLFSLFDDLGFNCDVLFSQDHLEDYTAVLNMGGYVLPFYGFIVPRLFSKRRDFLNLLLLKLAPGKIRLHLRFYDNADGSWYIAAHIDKANWMNFMRLGQVLEVHLKRGKGDYGSGTRIVFALLQKAREKILRNERLEFSAE